MFATEAKLAFGFSQGKAYVKGYEVRKLGTTFVDLEKARDFETDSGITLDLHNYHLLMLQTYTEHLILDLLVVKQKYLKKLD